MLMYNNWHEKLEEGKTEGRHSVAEVACTNFNSTEKLTTVYLEDRPHNTIFDSPNCQELKMRQCLFWECLLGLTRQIKGPFRMPY